MRFLALLLMLPFLAAAPLERERAQVTDAATQPVRFAMVDVRIDSKGKPLAAYQVEFIAPSHVKLAGIEGGDHVSFKDPPYYDPAAMSNSRVILAAFSTGSDLPKASFRAARLHVQIAGEQTPDWKVKLIVASDREGESIPATVTLAEASLEEGAAQ